jgi:hypothetical protein
MRAEQWHRAQPIGLRGTGDTDQLAAELQRRRQSHGTRQIGLGHPRQQRVARRHGEGADRAGGQTVGDQQRIAQPARHQHARQHQRRQSVEKVVAQQQPARVAAIGNQPAQRQEQDARRHQRHLRDADGEGIHAQHDRGQPREQHHLDAERNEPAGEPEQVKGKERAHACRRAREAIYCSELSLTSHELVHVDLRPRRPP